MPNRPRSSRLPSTMPPPIPVPTVTTTTWAQRFVAPGEVGREQHGRPFGIDEAGRPQADGLHLVDRPELADGVGDGVLRLRGIVVRRVAPRHRPQMPGLVDDTGGDLGTAHVDTDCQSHAGREGCHLSVQDLLNAVPGSATVRGRRRWVGNRRNAAWLTRRTGTGVRKGSG